MTRNNEYKPPFRVGDLVETKPFRRNRINEIGIVTSVVYLENEWFVNVQLTDGEEVYTYHGFLELISR